MTSPSIGALAILMSGVWVTAASGQGDTSAPPTSTTKEARLADEAGKIKAQVILVRMDWTGDDGVEGAEEILQSLLQDVPVPTSYTSLAANAPRMLFPAEFLSIYDPVELTSSIVWMAKRDLLHKVWEMSPPEDEEGAGDRRPETQQGRSYACEIFVDQEAVPPPSGSVFGEAPPYVHRVIGTQLEFQSSLRTDDENAATGISVIATRTLQVRDEFKNAPSEPDSVNIKSLGSERFSFDMPLDRVAVFPFHHAGRQFSREWYPIVIIMPAALDIPNSASDTLSKPSAMANIRPVGNRTRSPLSRSPAGGTRTPSAPASADESPATEIKVFSLQNAEASSAVDTLTRLLVEGHFVADERTNSVIATGATAELEVVEKLLLQIDGPAAESSKDLALRDTRDRPSLEEFLRSLRGKYSTNEEQALSVAQNLAAEKDAQAARRLRERLKIVVTESFGLRQELQKAELELLRERIRGIETQLQQRESLRDEIIKRRVEQLAGGEPVWRRPIPADSSDQRRDLSVTSRDSGAGVTRLRGLNEYRRAVEEVNAEIDKYEDVRNALRQQGQPGTQYDKAIAKLQQRLALIRDEYAAQIRLLELDVQAADAALNTAQRAAERMTALFEGGQAASTEMDQATLAHEQAKIRREQAQTLLDLYLKTGAATELLKPATDDARHGGVGIEALPEEGVLILRGPEDSVQRVIDTFEKTGKNRSKATGR